MIALAGEEDACPKYVYVMIDFNVDIPESLVAVCLQLYDTLTTVSEHAANSLTTALEHVGNSLTTACTQTQGWPFLRLLYGIKF